MSMMPSRAELKKNLKLLKERLEVRPMDLDARMRIARTYRLLDDATDAVAHYGAVARYLSLAGHPLQAVAVLKELLQVDPRHEETLLFLAKLYARTRAADPTNRGRVAVPILDSGDTSDAGVHPLTDGLPMTATGIWRAIRPEATEDLAVIHSADEVGAVVAAGEPIVDVVDPLTGVATTVRAGTSGVLFARAAGRFARPGKRLAKIAGAEPLRSGRLLSQAWAAENRASSVISYNNLCAPLPSCWRSSPGPLSQPHAPCQTAVDKG
jgi:hypothetical protein